MAFKERPSTAKAAPFAQIAEQATPTLIRRAMRLTRDYAEAWDLVQTTLERGFCSFDGFVDEPGNPAGSRATSWLCTIMNHRFIDLVRFNGIRRLTSVVDTLETPALDPEREPEWAKFNIGDVRRAARRLPNRLRLVFDLFSFQKIPIKQVAVRLGIPLGTVCSRLLRARRHIKQTLYAQVAVTPLRPALAVSVRRDPEIDERTHAVSASHKTSGTGVVYGSVLVRGEIAVGNRVVSQRAKFHRKPLVVQMKIETLASR